jgi:hypothetical protein
MASLLLDVASRNRLRVCRACVRAAAVLQCTALNDMEPMELYRILASQRTEDFTPLLHVFNRWLFALGGVDSMVDYEIFLRALITFDPKRSHFRRFPPKKEELRTRLKAASRVVRALVERDSRSAGGSEIAASLDQIAEA